MDAPTNLEIAGKVGVSEKTVRQRIRKLIERDGMRIIATRSIEPHPRVSLSLFGLNLAFGLLSLINSRHSLKSTMST